MFDLGQSFAEFQKGTGGQRVGLIPCEVDVTFNLSLSGKDNTDLGLTVESASFGYKGEAEGKRSNQVNMKLRHIACLDKSKLGSDPEAVAKLIKAFLDAGVIVMQTGTPLNSNLDDVR